MYSITGITGQVGGAVARSLLRHKLPVRAVVRDPGKGAAWAAQGCEVALADIADASTLAKALSNSTGVFVLLPSCFDPSPGFPEVRAITGAIRTALEAAGPRRVVAISTIGAQATEPNLLTQLGIMEEMLGGLPMPVTFLRPAWYMENSAWDVTAARSDGVIPSFLQPLEKPVPMVATADIGRVAAELLQQTWTGRRIIELEGPSRVSPQEIAATFSRILGRQVRTNAVPRETWVGLFKAQGMKNSQPRIRMLDGFNEGWIEFESGPKGSRKGEITLETVLKELAARQ